MTHSAILHILIFWLHLEFKGLTPLARYDVDFTAVHGIVPLGQCLFVDYVQQNTTLAHPDRTPQCLRFGAITHYVYSLHYGKRLQPHFVNQTIFD